MASSSVRLSKNRAALQFPALESNQLWQAQNLLGRRDRTGIDVVVGRPRIELGPTG